MRTISMKTRVQVSLTQQHYITCEAEVIGGRYATVPLTSSIFPRKKRLRKKSEPIEALRGAVGIRSSGERVGGGDGTAER